MALKVGDKVFFSNKILNVGFLSCMSSYFLENKKEIYEFSNGEIYFNSLEELSDAINGESVKLGLLPMPLDIDIKNKVDELKENQFQSITDGISELLRVKNQRYGACYKDRLKIFEGKCANGQRIDEKLSRIKNSGELRLNDLADVVGYLVLTIDELGYKGEDILKLID